MNRRTRESIGHLFASCVLALALVVGLAPRSVRVAHAAGLTPLTGATQVAAGEFHSCAILSDETVDCWGDNTYGQLGDGTKTAHLVAMPARGITGVVSLALGLYHTCALRNDGSVWCWGDDSYGNLGDGNGGGSNSSAVPVQVSGLSGAVQIAAGFEHTCALRSNGTVQCWGRGDIGQLGSGSSPAFSATPVTVSGIATAIAIGSGVGATRTCAVLADRTMRCWGSGYLGNSAVNSSNTPLVVTGLTNASAVWSGDSHVCVLAAAGSILCWGDNVSGDTGDGTTAIHYTYVTMTAIASAQSLGAGSEFSCAKIDAAQVKCWGDNTYGQLGDGTTTASLPPVAVGVLGVSGLSVGRWHVCVVVANGAIQCWGGNSAGQLGNGTTAAAQTSIGNVLTQAVTYTVTPSAGSNGTISPATPQSVPANATATFTVTPNAGYSAVVSGTCGGTLAGMTYTTNPIANDCTVVATFSATPKSVTTTALQLAPNPATAGQAVTASVVVAASAPTPPPPAGSVVTVTAGATSCTATLTNGSGNCALTFSSAGNYPVVATYGGDANYGSSSATQNEIVLAAVPQGLAAAPLLRPAGLLLLALLLVGSSAIASRRRR